MNSRLPGYEPGLLPLKYPALFAGLSRLPAFSDWIIASTKTAKNSCSLTFTRGWAHPAFVDSVVSESAITSFCGRKTGLSRLPYGLMLRFRVLRQHPQLHNRSLRVIVQDFLHHPTSSDAPWQASCVHGELVEVTGVEPVSRLQQILKLLTR